jgi:hypothetical protein
VQLQALRLGVEDCRDIDDLDGALRSLCVFINEIEAALERHGILKHAERWFWERQGASAPIWEGQAG